MVEPVTSAPPPLPGPVIMRQHWLDLAFLHWRVDPAAVAPLMPKGTVPDEYDGSTWVGLVPFRLTRAGLGSAPAVPWLGSFAETNVRLYSVDETGRRGVVFRSLEAERLLPVLAARTALRLPYLWARMQIERTGDVITYETARRWPGPRGVGGRVVVRVGPPLPAAGALAEFLTARWVLHTVIAGRTMVMPNSHEPWSLHAATLLELQDTLVAAAGLPGLVDRPPDSVLWSPGVRSSFGLPHAVRVRAASDQDG